MFLKLASFSNYRPGGSSVERTQSFNEHYPSQCLPTGKPPTLNQRVALLEESLNALIDRVEDMEEALQCKSSLQDSPHSEPEDSSQECDQDLKRRKQ